MTDRLPPHSIEAEQAVLGGILIDNSALWDVPFLDARHFFQSKNGDIFKALSDLIRADVNADFVTVVETLKARGIQDDAYIVGLLNTVPTSTNTRNYGRIVEAHAQRRALITAAGKIATLGWNEAQSINTTLEQAQSALFEVTDKAGINDAQIAREGLSILFDQTAERRASGGLPEGIKTGLIDLDRLLGGLRGGELIVLAARPGMGKSSLESGIATTAAKNGHKVLRFNLEMPAMQCWQRLMAREAKLPFQSIRDGSLSDSEWQTFGKHLAMLADLPMWIDDTSALTPQQLHSKTRRVWAEHGGIDLVTIDYLGLMSVESGKQNRTQEVGEISRSLKKLAKDLNIPVLALAQLNRSCEMRGDKHPILSDLRDSGDIEQDADIVMFIYRDEYYNDDTERQNVAEVNIAKHRNGPTGMIDLFFNGKEIAFRDLVRQEIYP